MCVCINICLSICTHMDSVFWSHVFWYQLFSLREPHSASGAALLQQEAFLIVGKGLACLRHIDSAGSVVTGRRFLK